MSSSTWLPSNDLGLSAVTTDLSAKLSLAFGAYGLSQQDALNLAAATALFNQTLAASTDPATRTRVSITARNSARGSLLLEVRGLARRIAAHPGVLAAQLVALGMPSYDRVPSPLPAPATRPLVNITAIDLARLTIRIADESTPSKRKRPHGISGAQVYAYLAGPGEVPPGDLEQWTFKGLATGADFDVRFNAADAGKKAHIIARWFDRKGRTGPSSLAAVGPVAA
jgi:hypothetical protein